MKTTTPVKYNRTWYYVKNSVMDKSRTLCKYNNVWYFVNNGKMDRTYTGYVNYNGSKYYVVKGIMQKKVK